MKVSAIVYFTDERNGNTLEVVIELPPTTEIHMRQEYDINSGHEIDRRATEIMAEYAKNLFRAALLADGAVIVTGKRQLHGG